MQRTSKRRRSEGFSPTCFWAYPIDPLGEQPGIGGIARHATRQSRSEPVAATPGTVDRAGRWLAALLPEGGSKHVAGFREALASRPDIVYLLTDADGLDEADVRRLQLRRRAFEELRALRTEVVERRAAEVSMQQHLENIEAQLAKVKRGGR